MTIPLLPTDTARYQHRIRINIFKCVLIILNLYKLGTLVLSSKNKLNAWQVQASNFVWAGGGSYLEANLCNKIKLKLIEFEKK